MAGLAGRLGDGICVPLGSTTAETLRIARQAWSSSDRRDERFVATALLSSWTEEIRPSLDVDLDLDLDRLIVYVPPPFEVSIGRLSASRSKY
jgi:hypothetical protein